MKLLQRIHRWWRNRQLMQRCPYTHKKCSRLRKRHGNTTICGYCASWMIHMKREWRGLD